MERALVIGDARKGCVWIRDATTQRRWAVLWPEGHRAAPLRIYDSDGVIVWREDEERVLGGGPSSTYIERIPPECRVGDRAWGLPLFRAPTG